MKKITLLIPVNSDDHSFDNFIGLRTIILDNISYKRTIGVIKNLKDLINKNISLFINLVKPFSSEEFINIIKEIISLRDDINDLTIVTSSSDLQALVFYLANALRIELNICKKEEGITESISSEEMFCLSNNLVVFYHNLEDYLIKH